MTARAARHENLIRSAREAYAHHTLVSSTPDCWRLQRPDDGMFWAVVATLPGDRLVIVGDGPDLIFWGGGCSGEVQVRWAAGTSLDHLASKVLPRQSGYAWDEGVALEAFQAAIDEARAEALGEAADALADALEHYRSGHGGEHEMTRAVYEATGDCEEQFGQVISSDVYYAQAAFRRLVELLDAQRGDPR